MPLYCYIVETGMYEDIQSHILGHQNKYSQEEFDDLCIEITEKYGDVEEVEYYAGFSNEHVEEIRYNISPEKLIEYLINDYGFIELNIPINNGHNTRDVSREPVPPENLVMHRVKPVNSCPMMEGHVIRANDVGVGHINARCVEPIIKKRGQ